MDNKRKIKLSLSTRNEKDYLFVKEINLAIRAQDRHTWPWDLLHDQVIA